MLFSYYINMLAHYFQFQYLLSIKKNEYFVGIEFLWILVRSRINWTIKMGIYFGIFQKCRYFVGMAEQNVGLVPCR